MPAPKVAVRYVYTSIYGDSTMFPLVCAVSPGTSATLIPKDMAQVWLQRVILWVDRASTPQISVSVGNGGLTSSTLAL